MEGGGGVEGEVEEVEWRGGSRRGGVEGGVGEGE